MKVAISVVLALAALAASAPAVDNKIASAIAANGVADVMVSMVNDRSAILRAEFDSKVSTFETREARLNAFYAVMKGHADEVQANVLSLLETAKASNPELRVEQSWITNQIILFKANAATMELLNGNADIAEMHLSREFPIEAPRDLKVYNSAAELPKAGEQWGVLNIRAEQVHATGNTGAGVVLANIDTGVRVTHEALRGGHRANYGWYDPYQRTTTPNDQNGHGTHTMGTIAGRANGVGVAPGAQWIACKGCSTSSCTEAALTSCGNWVACPTLPDGTSPNCAMAPKVSSNSWGGGQADPWYEPVISSWVTAGIVPLFSSGNSGPACGTSNSPSDAAAAIAVGSTTSANALSSFSSKGPTAHTTPRRKPDISAPGSSVVSAYYTSDTAYSTLSGTSMACPHAAGLTGLLFAENPNLTVAQVRTLLQEGARRIGGGTQTCGGISGSTYPNNNVGYGIIDAVNSVNAARQL